MSNSRTLEERVRETANLMENTCRSREYIVSGDGRVSETVAAELLGYAEGSLKNLRAMGVSPPFYNRGAGKGSRISYRLTELAEWVEIKRDEDVISRNST